MGNCFIVSAELTDILFDFSFRIRIDYHTWPLCRRTFLFAMGTTFIIIRAVLLTSKNNMKYERNLLFSNVIIIFLTIKSVSWKLKLKLEQTYTLIQQDLRNHDLCFVSVHSYQLTNPNFDWISSQDRMIVDGFLQAFSYHDEISYTVGDRDLPFESFPVEFVVWHL